MKYSDYLNTDYWKAVTAKVKERAGYRCQLCNSQHDLCAHHRTYDHRGSELEHLDDLVCLCRRSDFVFVGLFDKTDLLELVEVEHEGIADADTPSSSTPNYRV